jgi:S-adenosylmethionine decarboxylase
MEDGESRGSHIFLDYLNYSSPSKDEGAWMLSLMRSCVEEAGIREVHSHVEDFDGSVSPAGFAAVVLIDESHVTAHCYSDEGMLAIDVFTCGSHDPERVVGLIHNGLISKIEGISLSRKERFDRFEKVD